jgi:PIN domain nuclease of toxin-antitoxin system
VIRLLDTHLLVWSISASARLSTAAKAAIADPHVDIMFSAVNVWEVAIKNALGRPDFDVEPSHFRETLLEIGYEELPVTSIHALELPALPKLHRDPFDRMLIAQALAEDFELVTADRQIARYPGRILKV